MKIKSADFLTKKILKTSKKRPLIQHDIFSERIMLYNFNYDGVYAARQTTVKFSNIWLIKKKQKNPLNIQKNVSSLDKRIEPPTTGSFGICSDFYFLAKYTKFYNLIKFENELQNMLTITQT